MLICGALLLRRSDQTPLPSATTTHRPPAAPAIELIEDAASLGEASSTVADPAESGAIRGRIFLEAPPAPAPGASVAALLDRAHSYANAGIAAEDGSYELSGLAPGLYRVIAWRGTWAMAPLVRREELVEVRAGDRVEGIDRILLPGGILAGRVIEEETRDPIAGAHVELAGLIAPTDETGEFTLEGVSRGIHRVRARAAGFASATKLAHVIPGWEPHVEIELARAGVIEGMVTGIDAAPAAGAEVWSDHARVEADAEGRYVLEGVPLASRDFMVSAALERRLVTHRMVDGFPEGEGSIRLDLRLAPGVTFAGRVSDVRGRPVPGAEVHFSTQSGEISVSTWADGKFELEGAPPETYTLTARKAGHTPATRDLAALSSAEERRKIEIVLEPGHFVEGKVVDGSGAPIHHAWVAIDSLGDDVGPYPYAYTGWDGSFRLDGLRGEITLAAAKPGHGESRGNEVEPDSTGVVIVLEEILIEGVVVEKATGKEVPEFQVSFEWQKLQARDGRFRIDSDIRKDGPHTIMVLAEGYAQAMLKDVVPWSAAEGRKPLRVELERGGTLTGRVVSILGGAPIEGVRVTLVTDEKDRREHTFEPLSRPGKVVRKVTSGADGEFTVTGLSGPGTLLLESRGFARRRVEGVSAGDGAQSFRLSPAASVEGSVRDPTGEPVAGVWVHLHKDGLAYASSITGAHGKYRLTDLPEGAAKVIFRTRPYRGRGRGKMVDVLLRPGETAPADMVIDTGSIAGTLTRGGIPVGGAHVSVRLPEQVDSLETDQEGRFHLGELAAGAYEVRVDHVWEGGTSRRIGISRTVDVGAGESRCDIDLAATRVSGRVVRGDTREPVRGAHIALLDAERNLRAEATCASTSDAFDLEAPGSGSYWLAALSGKGGNPGGWAGPLRVEEGVGLEGIEVPLGGAGSVSALVLDAETGEPLSGATVVLEDAEGAAYRMVAAADAAGRAEIADLMPGSYRLEVGAEDHVWMSADLDIGPAAAEKTFELERGSRILIQISGSPEDRLCIHATVIEGGDPGWPRREHGKDPGAARTIQCASAPDTSTVVLRTRPGRYRIRIVVVERDRSVFDARNHVEDMDVDVPEAGEATVRLGAKK